MSVPPRAGGTTDPDAWEHRTLPILAAGSVEVPFLIQGHQELIERDTIWDEHSHPVHELLWNERGASSATVGSRIWTITPTLGLWMPAGTLHSGAMTAGTWFRSAFFAIRSTTTIADTPVPVEITPLLRLLLARLGEPGLADPSRAATETLVLDVLTPSRHELSVHLPTAALVRPIVDAVRADPGDGRGLADWAGELRVSPRTLTRAFCAETGSGFARWVATVRAQHAVALLAGGWTVEDVAEQVGYRSASAFGAAFRRTVGLTPGAFRAA
ncbi:helix-turn-helix transcriptional regulator [Nakamurella leprariae]|uniref:Helix-turn-helix domain-containing protein n=1 Tax=Nakamurella leprariae TaxID=2803911 RepID=A0A939BZ01_9ACTN|nr:AraC family transcriptional regulator [Nakamurella leprariae]MBM9467635.1 helix-turn-helix domain-containing protein [Nakamurella leprariae]